MMTQHKLHTIGNIIGLFFICAVLVMAFIDQILHHDVPCPLCLLQRVAFVAVGVCFLMNLKAGIRISHYGLMILSALLGFALAFRQLFLHRAPDDPGYGPLLLKLHLYSWSAIIFMAIIGFVAVAMLFERGFDLKQHSLKPPTFILVLTFLGLILANGISTFMECGIWVCPDNPSQYYLLGKATNF